jgi:hypothetical protein
MAIAVSWIEYDSANPALEKTPFKHDLPFLNMGTYRVNSWSSANNLTDVRKFVVGLRIQGTAAENIKIWMDGDRFDCYLQNNNQPQIRKNHQSRNYIFKVTDLDDVTMGWFKPCLTATSTNLDDTTYDNGTDGVGATLTSDNSVVLETIDGVDVVAGDRILVKNQNNPEENGIYVVTSVGVDTVTPWVLTRDLDLNQSDEIVPTMRVMVTYGASTDKYFGLHLISASPYTMGTTELYWAEQPRITTKLNDCKLATDGELISGFSAGIFTSAPLTIDGVTVKTYDRILVKDQSSEEENGIYYVDSVGNGSNGIWVRVEEFKTSNELTTQLSTKVTHGVANNNKFFLINLGVNTPPFTINTTPFTWDEYVPIDVFNNHSKTWNDLGMNYESSMNIGDSNITINKDSYSHRVGLAMYVPSGEPNQNLRNIHLLAEFDTSDE